MLLPILPNHFLEKFQNQENLKFQLEVISSKKYTQNIAIS